jgi:hypothetical protein
MNGMNVKAYSMMGSLPLNTSRIPRWLDMMRGEDERERDLPEAGRGRFMRWSLDGPPNGRESSRLGRRRSTALVCPTSFQPPLPLPPPPQAVLRKANGPTRCLICRVESIFLRMSASASFSHSVQQPRSERHKAKRSLSTSSFSHTEHSKEVGDMLSIYGCQQHRNHALL